MSNFVALSSVARVGLGFKSLQNDFFYVDAATIETYGIEDEFLEPITMLRQFDAGRFFQKAPGTTSIFSCDLKLADIRGTGALRYIQAMANRPAVQRKQTGKPATIRQVLEAQGGSLWYAPKAQPHCSHIWLRKAVSSVYAPFVFKTASVVDQRLNYVEPIADSWQFIASLLTSTVFTLAAEVNGSASMGAGALEMPTTKLREYPVPDPASFDAAKKKEVCRLAREVWTSEAPVDWEKKDEPGPKLQELDEYLLSAVNSTVVVDDVYKGLRETCRARLLVAKDKAKTTKKQKTDNVAIVAGTIATPLGRYLQSRQFPEQFVASPSPTMLVHVPQDQLGTIRLQSFFSSMVVVVTDRQGAELFKGEYDEGVATVIVRGLLLGRESFSVPTDPRVAREVNKAFDGWFDGILSRLEKAVAESSVGTGYDSLVTAEVYRLLNISPVLALPAFPPEVTVR